MILEVYPTIWLTEGWMGKMKSVQKHTSLSLSAVALTTWNVVVRGKKKKYVADENIGLTEKLVLVIIFSNTNH